MSTERTQDVGNTDAEVAVESAQAHETSQHEEEHIHLPGPSYWPLFLAIGIGIALTGLIVDITFFAVGILLAFIAGIGWGFGWGLERNQEAPAE